jgi:hypothetical protein
MGNTPNKLAVNSHLMNVAAGLDRTFMIDNSAADGQLLGDGIHWNTAGMRTCGIAMKNSIRSFYGSRCNLI